MTRLSVSSALLFASLIGLTACPGSGSTSPDSTPRTSKPDEPQPNAGESSESEPEAPDVVAARPSGSSSGAIPGPTLPAGAACETDADCDAAQLCEGLGCGTREGRCAPRDRMCTRDLATYCGCDGKEFQTSGSCPGARFAHRGSCSAGLGLGESCTSGRQCASGLCSGEALEGCGTRASGQCSEAGCTKDLATYCGCNGFEFQASGSCPNQQFAYRGPCEG